MLDENGKLFGKINIIDLLIIIIIIAAAIFVGLRLFGGNDNDMGTPQHVRVTFFSDEAPALLIGKGVAGSPVIDYDNNNYLGALTIYETEDAYTYTYDSESGDCVKVPVVNRCFLTFSCEGNGYVTEDALYVNGFQYSVGGTCTIRAGQIRVQCRMASIEVLD